MWLFGFFLIPLVLATGSELSINNYIIKIDGNTLTRVQTTQTSPNELDLSGLGLQRIEKFAFTDLPNVKILSLANNSLNRLPESIFSNLTNLEHLSLDRNNIDAFGKAFVGLGNLKTLNISNNPVDSLRSREFTGLSTSVNIFTQGNRLKKISMNVFGNDKKIVRKDKTLEHSARRSRSIQKPSFRAKACIDNGKLMLVSIIEDGEILSTGCTEVMATGVTVYINNLNVTNCERGWYQINDTSITLINLSNNNIARVTNEMLDDLPKNVVWVDLSGNNIERLENGTIVNLFIEYLNLEGNSLREIENGTFEQTRLSYLELSNNQLQDLKFANSLPPTINSLDINNNELTEIPGDSFSNLHNLQNLRLAGNYITEIQKDSFRGMPKLDLIELYNNRINRLEPGCFRHFKTMGHVNLRGNIIAKLEKGAFDGPERFEVLDLGDNKFTNVIEQIRDYLPKDLSYLYLDSNNIESLESGSFINVPKNDLELMNNKIAKIEKGAFYLPSLNSLGLGDNSLSEVDGHLFENFRDLRSLSLNGNNLTTIEKGFAKHLFSLTNLDISLNHIKKLENGALFGIRQYSMERFIKTDRNPIEIIQGGLFDDV